MAQTPYKSFKFGFTEAQLEGVIEPELLLKGFLDPAELIHEVRFGHKFVFLGYKGSGKSSIAEHLRLTAINDSNLFVTNTMLSQFPYSDFARIVRGDAEDESRFPTAWSWLILLALFGSFARDEGAYPESRGEFASALEVLDRTGLLPTPSLKDIVRVTSKRSFKLSLPKVAEAGVEQARESSGDIPGFVDRLRILAATFRSDSTHLLVIDGLDDILSDRKVQYKSLAALIDEANQLNMHFRRNGTPAKIIVLCRTDLYERLPHANKNKIRQDSAVVLDWYHDVRHPGGSRLVSIANLRAKLIDSSLEDLFRTYFPATTDGQQTLAFLLDLTRHTPRDFLQLLSKLQEFSSESVFTREQMLSGVRSYSIDYFLPEIRDELHGYVEREHVDLVFDLIGATRKRDFGLEELSQRAQKEPRYADLKLEAIFHALFECSAVGNVHNRPGGTTYYTFKFRNRNSTLRLEDRLILHKGLWKAMNLV